MIIIRFRLVGKGRSRVGRYYRFWLDRFYFFIVLLRIVCIGFILYFFGIFLGVRVIDIRNGGTVGDAEKGVEGSSAVARGIVEEVAGVGDEGVRRAAAFCRF